MLQEELPEVDDCRPVAREEGFETLRVPLVGETLVCVPRIRRVEPRLVEQRRKGLVARLRAPLLDVDSRRHLVNAVDVAADVLDNVADVRRADEDGARAREHVPPPRFELGPAAHRVLQLRPVRLHGIGRARRATDRAAEQHVVAQEKVGRQMFTHGRRVRLDPRVELAARAVLEQLDAVALVVIEYEGGQEASHVGPDDSGAPEVVALRMRLLAENGDLVPRPRPLASELARVDVRPRPSEEVPVPEENPHRSDGIPSRVGHLSRLRLGLGLRRLRADRSSRGRRRPAATPSVPTLAAVERAMSFADRVVRRPTGSSDVPP